MSSLALIAAMAGPVALGASAQERRDDDRGRPAVQIRVYDRHHRDYHNWDDHESRAYVRWETDNRRRHREYARRQRAEQNRYWAWRHNHPDRD